MELGSILDKIFYSQEREHHDPNKPEDSAFFNARRKIVQQAYRTWYKDHGGQYAIKGIESEFIEYLKALVLKDIKGLEDIVEIIAIKQHLRSLLTLVDYIETAFETEEK